MEVMRMEKTVEDILEKLNDARRVVVARESAAHGENYVDAYGNLQIAAVFDHYFVVEIDNKTIIEKKIEDEEDEEECEAISDLIHEAIVERIVERVAEIVNDAQDVEWLGGCDYGCCLFFETNNKKYRVKFADFNDINTTHYKANTVIYTLDNISITEE